MLLVRADSEHGPLAGGASTQVNVGAVDDLRLTLDRPGTIDGRIIAAVPASARPRTIALRQTLVDVSVLYPVPEGPIGPDGRFQVRNAFGEYEFELRGLPTGMRIKSVS